MWDELENALAWYAAAPGRWVQSSRQDLAAAADWIWIVIQGDFAEDQSAAQIATGTVISMVPFVDQLCDIRDVVANCKKISEEGDFHLRSRLSASSRFWAPSRRDASRSFSTGHARASSRAQ